MAGRNPRHCSSADAGSGRRGLLGLARAGGLWHHAALHEPRQGARLYDVDANEYIDWMMAFGALPLGHAHPQGGRGGRAGSGTRHPFRDRAGGRGRGGRDAGEAPAPRRQGAFRQYRHEAAMGAFRLARGHTGRRKIIKFEGHYHGWWDAVLVNTTPIRRHCWAIRTIRSAFPTVRAFPKRRERHDRRPVE